MATDSSRLEELLDQWEKGVEAGTAPSAEELCRDCPELLGQLKERIAALQSMNDRLETKPYSQLPGSTPPLAPKPAPPAAEVGVDVSYGELRFHDEGGLGLVFMATDQRLHREVALKFIRERYADDPENRSRFLREAEVTARLEHPGIVPVHGIGETATGQLFYAMRFIRGETLEAALQRYHQEQGGTAGERSVEFRKLLAAFVSVCKTIAYAHNRGIVHRDLKPVNIMLGRYGETLVVDWGLALPVGRDARARASGEKTLLPSSGSQSGTSSAGGGTPAYMSPEQAEQSLDIGPATDIYSLGATLYKILTGEVPYRGRNVREVLDKVKQGHFPPPRQVKAGVPRALEAVCLKAMAFEPRQRYATALDLAADVERWLADEPVTAWREPAAQRLARWGRRHRSLVLGGSGALLAVLLVAVVAAVWLGRLANQEREARERGLLLSARFAARTLANEMDIRWRILEAEANDADLQRLLALANGQPNDPATRRALCDWLDRRYHRHDATTRASTWFVDDRRGTLVGLAGQFAEGELARSLGKNYAHRDYFHGRGRDLNESEAVAIEPIQQPHRSTVFLSRVDKKLKVAFSVPVRSSQPEAEIIGVLAMTVELGHFGALQTELGPNQLAVLVDTRPDWIDGDERQGLVLHHRRLVERQLEGYEPQTFRLPADLVERLIQLRGQRLRQDEAQAHPSLAAAARQPIAMPLNLERDYVDPTGGPYEGAWLAAYEPVLVKGRTDPRIKDTGWVVIVQERP